MAAEKKGFLKTIGEKVFKTKEEFDVAKALDNRHFLESLGQFDDFKKGTLDPETDQETIRERYEAFEKEGEAAKKLKTLFTNEIQRDIGWKLDAESLKEIGKFIEKEAVENP